MPAGAGALTRTAAQQNRASVERHTSFKNLWPSRSALSRGHYGVVLRRPPSVELGERLSSDRHDARPIPDNQHLTTRAPGRNQQAAARQPRSPTGGSWRFPERFRYARKRFHTYVSPSGLSLSR